MQRITSNRPESVYISWRISNTCNFNCSYCDPMFYNGTHRVPDYDNIMYFIKQVAETTTEITLELSGGEITLWPRLIELLQEIKQYTNVTIMIITNGSRTNAWWRKYAAANLHMDTLFYFSYHHGKCDPELFYSNLEIISEKHNVVALMMMIPEHFDTIKDLAVRIKDTLPVDVSFKLIRETMESSKLINGYIDDHFDMVKSYDLNYDRSKYQKESDSIVWPTELFYNGEQKHWQTMLINNEHSFKDWKCAAGSKRLLIDFNGDVYVCVELSTNKDYILGNINRRDVKLLDDYITCPSEFCSRKNDAITKKYKDD